MREAEDILGGVGGEEGEGEVGEREGEEEEQSAADGGGDGPDLDRPIDGLGAAAEVAVEGEDFGEEDRGEEDCEGTDSEEGKLA